MYYEAQPAFVLHARAYRETSLLIEVLSRDHGRIGLLARGVHGGSKRHPLRAALQPFQHIRLDAVQRGELAQLRAAEALDAAPVLQGDAGMAVFYINELVLRMAPRLDPVPEVYAVLQTVRARLGSGTPVAWTLRRFERDLLEALGVGLPWGEDVDGRPLDAAVRYRVDPEQGPRKQGHDAGDGITGQALLLFAQDQPPDAAEMPALRRVLRGVLLHHLGGRGLQAWTLLPRLEQVLRE